ncbi:MAG: putative toxin-antitoxin system toxin component, PIN family, partial [Candidatus Aenigmarchaeota archaeon]|nr:putative toxin-antitoxin system toxin component, PIN family [Candidatus Aenigmarchaeota archaeon]
MKITLDTNVLVSAFISKKGNPAKILNLIADIDGIQLILSEEILDEFKDVLSREKIKEVFGWKQKDIDDIVKTVRDAAVIVKVKSDFKTVNEDSNDDMV